FDDHIAPEIAGDGLRLGGRFDDNERFRHVWTPGWDDGRALSNPSANQTTVPSATGPGVTGRAKSALTWSHVWPSPWPTAGAEVCDWSRPLTSRSRSRRSCSSWPRSTTHWSMAALR